jgi:DNA-binding transcriptional regulator YiaG
MTKTKTGPTFTYRLTPIDSDMAPIDDAMDVDDFNDLLDKLGLSQVAAARLLGVSGRSVRRWAAGDLPVAPPVVRFLRFLERADIEPMTVMETLAS